MNLRHKTTHAVLWSATDIFSRQGLQFIVLIILARILTPGDFGVVAMLGVFVGVASVFIDGGFSSALIQRQNITPTDESTVFYFNLAMGLGVTLLLCIAAPWIAVYFKQPVLHSLTYAMALNVLVNAFGSIHTTLLSKDLNFRVLAKVGVFASFLSGTFAIVLASKGYGVWSLVGKMLVASTISVLLLWFWHPWRPIWAFSFASLRSFFRFGGYLMVTNMANTLYTNLSSVLIGKFYTVRDVGFYERAQKTQFQPVNLVMLIINRVAFPVFSAASHDKDRLLRGFRKAQRLVMFLNIPLLLSMILLAKPIMAILFGEQWLPSAPILQVLGIAGIMFPLHAFNLNVLKAQGRSDLFFRIMWLKHTIAISLTVAASYNGIMAIAWAQVVASALSFMLNAYYSGVLLNYGALKQLRDLLPFIGGAIPMALSMWFVLVIAKVPNYVLIAIVLSTGALVYLMIARILCKDVLTEIRELVRKIRPQNIL